MMINYVEEKEKTFSSLCRLFVVEVVVVMNVASSSLEGINN